VARVVPDLEVDLVHVPAEVALVEEHLVTAEAEQFDHS
jgi:hypothetical protein